MATKVNLLAAVANTHRGTNTAKLNGSTSGWIPLLATTAAGPGGTTVTTTNTVTGATNGIEVTSSAGGNPLEWLSDPVDADVTISGAITGNIWASENNMSANVAINFLVDKIAATDGTITQIVKSARVTEVAVTTRAVNNFTATPGAGVTVNKGDRLRVRIFGDDAGTMATGFTFSIGYGNTANVGFDGDTYVQFTETFGFQTTDPTGTKLYMSATVSDVGTASTVDREMWTTAGSATLTGIITNTATGWTAPIQATDTAGGTVAEWFSKSLQAFTLSGLAKLQVRCVSANNANASARVEVARVDSNGSNAVVWGVSGLEAVTSFGSAGEIGGTLHNADCWVAGVDLAFTDGQRLRVRFFVDDCADVPLVTAFTVDIRYDGADATTTWLQVEQTLAEFVTATPVAFPFKRKDPSRPSRDFDPWSLTGWQ